jgi:hypothetical protein
MIINLASKKLAQGFYKRGSAPMISPQSANFNKTLFSPAAFSDNRPQAAKAA